MPDVTASDETFLDCIAFIGNFGLLFKYDYVPTMDKWTTYKHVSGNSKKCLSVGNFGSLSVCL